MTLEPIPSLDSPVLKEIVRRAVEVAHPLKIYLFGSVARCEVGPNSDYDLMLVVPDDTPDERCRGGPIYQALVGLDPSASVDIVVFLQSRFEELATYVVASLPATVVREGKLLYAR